MDPTIADIREIAAADNQFPLPDPAHEALFDIHWSLTRPNNEKPVDEAELWARAQSYRIAGRSCLSLDLEDHLLLLLCFHAAHHHRFQYVGPRALLDMGQALTCHPARSTGWCSSSGQGP